MSERAKCISVKEVQQRLGCGRVMAYEIVGRADFPAIHLGCKIVVPLDAFEQWLHDQTNKERAHNAERIQVTACSVALAHGLQFTQSEGHYRTDCLICGKEAGLIFDLTGGFTCEFCGVHGDGALLENIILRSAVGVNE